jgi:hypothetical protein
MPGLRVLKATDLVGPAEPFELLGGDDDIGGMGATGEFAAARTVAILKYILRPMKLVVDGAAEAAAAD